MNRISAYQTSDARIHEDRGIARAHQAYLDLVAWLDAYEEREAGTTEEVALAMCEDADALVKLLRIARKAGP